MALTVSINCDSSDLALGASGIDWVEFEEGQDQIVFTGGSAEVIDGADSPSSAELVSAGVDLSSVSLPYTLTNYLLLDNSANLLKSIDNMGDVNKRYVVAFDFDAATASEPVLEVWDDSNLNTATGTFLGAGTPSSSMVRGVVTTGALPGASWATTGTKLAGSSSGNYLELNSGSGALSGAGTLYCNLAIIIPASQTTGFSSSSVFVVKYLSN